MHTQVGLLVVLFSVATSAAIASLLEPIIENVVHLQTSLPPPDQPGVWRKKMIWKARWVQEWKYAKTYKPVWRKVWSPVEIREWLPIPKPPPVFVEPSPPSAHPDNTITPSAPPPDHPPFKYLPPGSTAPSGPPTSPPFAPSGPPTSHPFTPSGPPTSPPFVPSSGPPASGPPSSPSQPPSSSTLLYPVNSREPPSWPSNDNQELLSNYHTIREPDVESFQDLRQSRPATQYQVGSSNAETLAQFLEPPKFQTGSYLAASNSSKLEESKPSGGSWYANQLAQAVLRDKFNKEKLNLPDRPSGLTDVIYRPNQSSTTTVKPNRVTKAAAVSTTETNRVFIVTPISTAA